MGRVLNLAVSLILGDSLMQINLSVDEKKNLIDSLLNCPSLANQHTRQDIINELPSMIRDNVRDNLAARPHILQLVNTCFNYPNGISELLEILRLYEGDSLPMRQVLATWEEILTQPNTDINIKPTTSNTPPVSIKHTPVLMWVIGVGFVGLVGILLYWGFNDLVILLIATPLPLTQNANPNMVFIPAGEFTMGSNTGADDEMPVHLVYLDEYWIDKYETTNAQYAECVSAGKCTPREDTKSYTRDSYYGNIKYANYPVIKIDWIQAKSYCEFAGKRLPTEAEWEKAARGTDGRIYPWGNEEPNDKLLNYNGKVGDTTQVGFYLNGASIYGVMDMAGNVWEWVSSDYKKYPYKADDGREDAILGDNKVLRGGGWHDNGYFARATNRGRGESINWYTSRGIRCVR